MHPDQKPEASDFWKQRGRILADMVIIVAVVQGRETQVTDVEQLTENSPGLDVDFCKMVPLVLPPHQSPSEGINIVRELRPINHELEEGALTSDQIARPRFVVVVGIDLVLHVHSCRDGRPLL